jgi:hypothetical protein
MHINRISVLVTIGSLLVFASNGCGMRSSLDEGDSIEEISVASAMDSGTKETDETEQERSYCGDGRLDLQNNEQCDGTNVGYATCASLGQGMGTLKCSEGCYFDVSGCYPPPTNNVTPPEENQTTPVGPGDNNSSAYGSDALSDLIDRWINRTRDSSDSDDGDQSADTNGD